jgi:hypothetical protein
MKQRELLRARVSSEEMAPKLVLLNRIPESEANAIKVDIVSEDADDKTDVSLYCSLCLKTLIFCTEIPRGTPSNHILQVISGLARERDRSDQGSSRW